MEFWGLKPQNQTRLLGLVHRTADLSQFFCVMKQNTSAQPLSQKTIDAPAIQFLKTEKSSPQRSREYIFLSSEK